MRKEVRMHRRLAHLADRQHGVVSARQLRALGYSSAAISRATAAGRLHRVHHGVYTVGRSLLSPHGHCRAAVGTCGPDALLSHTSAAWLWGLLPTLRKPIEVSVPRRGRPRDRITVHRAPSMGSKDRAEQVGIPVTTIPRAFLDLASSGATRLLQQSVERAERLGRLDLADLDELLRRNAGKPGARRVREATELYRDPAFSRARSELLFLDLIKKAGLPRPALNTFVAGHEIDAYWERERFAVEVDGWEFHRTRAAFEADPLRLEKLKLAGVDAIRITARRIEREPQAVARTLRALLAQPRAVASLRR
jgi:predicted transcriptional regulator of viral defense system